MAGTKRRRATPEQMAMYSHVAARVRALLERKQWTPGELAKAIGLSSTSLVYQWLNCKAGVGSKFRRRVAQLCECTESDLETRASNEPLLEGPVRAPSIVPRPAEILSFAAFADATARIRFDCTLPIERAMPLLRLLLDAGMIMASAADEVADRN